MSTAAADKGFLIPRFSVDHPPLDAIISSAKNKLASMEVNYIGGEGSISGTPSGAKPFKHSLYWYVGGTVPNNTDYPDSIAPIGSMYTRLIITAGAVSGSALYIKTAAATWTIAGSVI